MVYRRIFLFGDLHCIWSQDQSVTLVFEKCGFVTVLICFYIQYMCGLVVFVGPQSFFTVSKEHGVGFVSDVVLYS